jgi:hypothetical protein
MRRARGPIRKGSRASRDLDSDCLFPREQEATGMNSTVLTASLTGRIQFLLRCVATTNLTYCCCGLLCPPLPCCDSGSLPQRGGEPESERGYEPPGAIAPCTSAAIASVSVRSAARRWRCRPARGASELVSPHSPSGVPLHRWIATRCVTTRIRGCRIAACVPSVVIYAPGDGFRRYERSPQALTELVPRRVKRLSIMWCEAVSPRRGDNRSRGTRANPKRASLVATVTPKVTLPDAVTGS